jgi:hypothetical protein
MLSVPGELTTPCRLSCFWQMDMRWPATETKARRLFRRKLQFVCSIFCPVHIDIHPSKKVCLVRPKDQVASRARPCRSTRPGAEDDFGSKLTRESLDHFLSKRS